MSPDPIHAGPTFAEVEALFHRAMDAPEPERQRLVEQSTAGNPALRSEVLSLLNAISAVDLLSGETPSSGQPNSPAPAAAAIGVRLGAFQIDRLLGRGGMGEVYAGHRVDADLQQIVAIKIIAARLDSPVLRTIFFHERDALARLHHAHIARLLDGGVTPENSPYLVMEIVGDEATPAQRLDEYCESRRLSLRERVALFITVCDAVSYAHQKLIVHGDLKPGNVLVGVEGNVKLLDFGAARLLAADDSASRPPAFTPGYASPEQMRGEPITVSSDVYSMGKLLQRILGAQKDAELAAVIACATGPHPNERYITAERLARDLRGWLDHLPLKVYSTQSSYRMGKWLRRNRTAVTASAVVLIALAASIVQTQRSARRAIAERDRAIRSAASVEALTHRLLFDLQPQLKDISASTDAQHQLATTTVTFLNELSSDPALASPALRLDMVSAYTRMGNLLDNPYEENLGQPQESVAALQKAVSTAMQLVHDGSSNHGMPSNKDAIHALAYAQTSLGEVEFGQGDTKAALQEIGESVKNFQLLANAPDAKPELLMETAASWGTLGDVYGLPGEDSLERDAEAINSYRQQIALSERALKINPNYGAARRTEAIGEYKIANMLLEKDPAVAIAGYQRALADIAMMPAQAQSAAPTLRLVYLLEAHMGRAYAVQGKMKDAITTIQRAHDEVAEIVANDPLDNRARFDLATTDRSLGDDFAAVGDRTRARKAYQDSLQNFDVMLRRDPGNTVVKDHRHDIEIMLRQLDHPMAKQGAPSH